MGPHSFLFLCYSFLFWFFIKIGPLATRLSRQGINRRGFAILPAALMARKSWATENRTMPRAALLQSLYRLSRDSRRSHEIPTIVSLQQVARRRDAAIGTGRQDDGIVAQGCHCKVGGAFGCLYGHEIASIYPPNIDDCLEGHGKGQVPALVLFSQTEQRQYSRYQ